MNRKRILLLIATALLIGTLIVVCLVGVGLCFKRTRQAAIATEIKVDVANYTAALVAFSNTFGSLPMGSNVTITPLLMGRNSRRMMFINIPTKRISAFGEFTDPTGKPYKIDVMTNTINMAPQ